MAGYLQKKYSDKAKLDYRLVRKPSYQQKKNSIEKIKFRLVFQIMKELFLLILNRKM